jgi:hypothetical protein
MIRFFKKRIVKYNLIREHWQKHLKSLKKKIEAKSSKVT